MFAFEAGIGDYLYLIGDNYQFVIELEINDVKTLRRLCNVDTLEKILSSII